MRDFHETEHTNLSHDIFDQKHNTFTLKKYCTDVKISTESLNLRSNDTESFELKKNESEISVKYSLYSK